MSPNDLGGHNQSRSPVGASPEGFELASGSLHKAKNHLPEVILSHKMREFEAKMNASSLLADPLDTSLSRLSIEEKERVMARMQEKIHAITTEIEANFFRIRKELDANGVFDSAANYERAQAICLVDLQRRCKLERLRDEAIDEVIEDKPKQTMSFTGVTSSAKRMEHSLTEMLATTRQQTSPVDLGRSGERPRVVLATAKHHDSSRKRNGVLPKLAGDSVSGGIRSSTAPASSANMKMPTTRKHSNRRTAVTHAGKRDHQVDATKSKNPPETNQTTTADIPSSPPDEVWSHHPHVLHVIQALNSGGYTSAPSSRPIPNASDFEVVNEKQLDSREKWQQRSISYQMIARRTSDEFWQRSNLLRWDTEGHFTASHPVVDHAKQRKTPSPALLNRLETQRSRLERTDEGEPDHSSDLDGENETLADRRLRSDQEYMRLQAQIIERLKTWHKPRVSPGAGTLHKARARRNLNDIVVPNATLIGSSSLSAIESKDMIHNIQEATSPHNGARGLSNQKTNTAELSNKDSSELTDQLQQQQQLGASSSAPTIQGPSERNNDDQSSNETSASGLPSTSNRRPGTRHRLSILEQRLIVDQDDQASASAAQINFRSTSRRGLRRESRIGAPPVADFAMFGRHSGARMAERRSSAQTWGWHQPNDEAKSGLDEESEDDDDDDDLILEEGDEESDSDDEEEPGGDQFASFYGRSGLDGLKPIVVNDLQHTETESEDTRSHASNSLYTPQTARSSTSVSTTVSASSKKPKATVAASIRRRRNSKSKPGVAGAGKNAGLSGEALSLHMRLEAVWKALEFPFSHKLLMVEKYAELEDPDAFERALECWEAAAHGVTIRERMKSIITEFTERRDLQATTKLASEQVIAVVEMLADIGEAVIVQPDIIEALPPDAYVRWVSVY